MRKSSFKDSLKALEADIQHANTLALDYPRERDGARLQMRLSYSPAAQFFLFLVQWTDIQLAGALGLLNVHIYMTYADGKTTMSVYERKASIREFYAVIFPSLLQLQRGITDLEDRKQKEACTVRYRRKDESARGKISEIDCEREDECSICMEMNGLVVLPNCSHSMCLNCYSDWHDRSQSCPFCRDSLVKVDSCDLWIYIEQSEIAELSSILRENRKRLFTYIDRLPLIVPDPVFAPFDVHVH
ncbi:E3 ubiquitin-protein ligase AIRP2-like [Gossypium arboreum]|uniref:E3 ubiquitin-protein ligase AIRP2-like n=1 Tax=Gossypium arboreum TaxID=29729 RepID=UPI0008195877|nr:E3 ubiquitin-protein ligase AIRP2-like [Gossypium arboreum]